MDEATFTEKIRQCEQKLYRIARSLLRCDADCADALQEAILRAWLRRGHLREIERFDAWLARIVVNQCHDMARRAKRRQSAISEAEAAEAPPPDPALRDALMALPEKYRLPLLLHHLEGYAVSEIASILAIPQTTVKWRLHEARARLRKALAEEVEL